MSLAELLTIIFVVLKLTGAVGWSWWAVCSPIMIAVGLRITAAMWRYS